MHRSYAALLLMSFGFTGCVVEKGNDCWDHDHCPGPMRNPSPPQGAGPSTGPSYVAGDHPSPKSILDASSGETRRPDAGTPGYLPGSKWDSAPPNAGLPHESAGTGASAVLGGAQVDAGNNFDPRPDAFLPCFDAGVCGKPTLSLCTFNRECGPGGRCANGECQRACVISSECGSGAACQSGFCQAAAASGGQCLFASDCGAGAACINGYCHAGCKSDSDCPNHVDACSAGLCRPNLRPSPQCRANQDCAQGQECVNAACRTPCASDDNCGILCSGTTCDHGFCMKPQELAPQCSRDGDCGAGRACIDAVCL